MSLRSPLRCLSVLCLLLLGSCKSAAALLYAPKPDDRLDGYSSLEQAGNNTDMDWGPKQNLLLSDFKTLREEHTRLEKRLEDVMAENQNLKSQLNNESRSLQQEKVTRAQIEAQKELKEQKLREQEATILSLRIEKAKLEQASLLSRLDALRQTLEQAAPNAMEAAAPLPGRK